MLQNHFISGLKPSTQKEKVNEKSEQMRLNSEVNILGENKKVENIVESAFVQAPYHLNYLDLIKNETSDISNSGKWF